MLSFARAGSRRHLPPALALALCSALVRAGGIGDEVDVALSCGSPAVEVDLPTSASLHVASKDPSSRWLEISEAGVDLVVDDMPAGTFKVTVPTRYGRYFVPVESGTIVRLRRAQVSGTVVHLRPRLWCTSDSPDSRVAWHRGVASVSNELMPVPSALSQAELLVRIKHLSATASVPENHALVAHLRAQALFATGAASEAAPAFALAEEAWQRAGDGSRSLAARVGRVEDLIRAARYEDALQLAVEPPALASAPSYFTNRLTSARCMVLRYLGRLDEALPCYDASITWLRDAGEDTERASMLIDQADVLRRVGRGEIAEERTAQARAIAAGPYAPFVRGRAELMLYDLLLDRGNVVDAIERIQAALGEFSEMRDERWQANAMLRAAWLYAQLGAVGEARSLIDSARGLLNEKDAPARIAAAWMLSAEAEIQGGDPDLALAAARKAEAAYAQLGMAVELDDCRAMIAGLVLQSGDQIQAAALLRDRGPEQPGKFSWALLEAGLAIARGESARAHTLLSSLKLRQGGRFSDDIRRVALEARLLATQGQHADALDVLREAARSVAVATAAVDNRLLAGLLRRGTFPLRAVAFELLLQEAARSSTPEENQRIAAEAWDWLVVTAESAPSNRADEGDAASVRFDGVLARQLLLDPSRSRNPGAAVAARSLLQNLAARGHADKARLARPPVASLDKFQGELPLDATFVAHLDAGAQGGMLWISREHARLVPAAPALDLRRANAVLTERLTRPGATLAEVDTAAESLSRMMFESAPDSDPPAHLLVALDGEISSIPWSVLRWSPGAEQLVATATTSFVHLRNDCCDSLATPNRVRMVIAPQAEADAGLSPLPVAASEMALVQDAVAAAGFRVEPTAANDREAIFGALAAPGEWVHIAAHGQTVAGRLGRSGIWIERGKTDGPQFLSGIGLLGRDIRSELVVMDGCELDARTGHAGAASLNFADAAAKAGARNVIAAMWPVSDSAAVTWVPAFYRAALDPGEPRFARALQEAQLQLRASRRYRHPYYWASLRHTEVIGTGAAANEARIVRR